MDTTTLPPGLTVQRVPIDSLQLDPANVRQHDRRSIEAIRGSLARFGQQTPLVIDKRNVVRKGNGTLQAARELGWAELDVVVTGLDGTDAVAYSIADNRTSDLSTFDPDALAKTLDALRLDDAMDGVAFSDEEIQEILDSANVGLTEVREDEVPAPPDQATSRTGDLWLLGEHRLLVGDASLREDVDRLMAGARIQLVNTDPPYGVKVEPRSNNAIAAGLSSFSGTTHHQKLDVERHPSKAHATHDKLRAKDRPLANDFLSDEDFAALLRKWFANVAYVLEPGRAFYIWGGYGNLGNYPQALAENGLYFSQGIVWDKQHPVLTRKDYMGAYEIAFYGWREGSAHVYLGPNNATDLWPIKKVAPQHMSHLTEKPVALAARAIEYSSRKGENVCDFFGGSGSTLIACEQLDRRCYTSEIDGLYADLIVTRWQTLTGKDALLDGSDKTFAQVAAERRSS